MARRATLKLSIGRKCGVEVVGEIFAGEIADDANAIERHREILRRICRARRFHFDDRGPAGAQLPLFRGCRGHMIDGSHGAGSGFGTSRRVGFIGALSVPDFRRHENVSDPQLLPQRAAKTDVAYGRNLAGQHHGGEGAGGAALRWR